MHMILGYKSDIERSNFAMEVNCQLRIYTHSFTQPSCYPLARLRSDSLDKSLSKAKTGIKYMNIMHGRAVITGSEATPNSAE